MVRGGGIAGLVSTASVDTTDLDDEHAALLRARVAEARNADGTLRAPTDPAGTTAPDEYSYEVSIEDDDGTSHRLRSSDTTLPAGVRELVDLVRTLGRR